MTHDSDRYIGCRYAWSLGFQGFNRIGDVRPHGTVKWLSDFRIVLRISGCYNRPQEKKTQKKQQKNGP